MISAQVGFTPIWPTHSLQISIAEVISTARNRMDWEYGAPPINPRNCGMWTAMDGRECAYCVAISHSHPFFRINFCTFLEAGLQISTPTSLSRSSSVWPLLAHALNLRSALESLLPRTLVDYDVLERCLSARYVTIIVFVVHLGPLV